MAYQRTIWQDDVTDVDATNMNHIEDGIEKAYGVELLAVVDTAPSECSEGDKYFNTTTNKIYEATATDTWDTEGYDAESGVFYVVFEEKAIYTYNGTTLVGVGSSGAGGESLPVGSIIAFAGSTAPEGYLMCDGSNVSRTTYGELFNVIGTTYGQGDTTTTFGLPNIKGRVLVGLDAVQNEFYALGVTGGEKKHTLTINEIPSHNHYLAINGGSSTGTRFTYTSDSQKRMYGGDDLIGKTGGGLPHNNLQPYIVVNYIIKAHPSAVNTSEVVNEHSTSETDVYSANRTNIEIANAISETYSTSEVKTNKVWIDGKPIYRKTFSGSYSDNATLINNVSNIVNVYGTASVSGLKRAVPYYEIYQNQSFLATVNLNNSSQVKLSLSEFGSGITSTINITIEYTK